MSVLGTAKALDDDPEGHAGLVSAHFHLSTDGGHVLNYAEWPSADAYDRALAAPSSEVWVHGDGPGAPTGVGTTLAGP
ncbi:hypothetical protein ABZ281_24090 [Streptomyces sp. NPDC006265]|uniref:hypothetical protein n=1 Tax=Streptomyces sp. NPDC006265 TaxID=3156740 RepID=UPI0033BA0413